jgi:preprotein translocase subunit YajC
VNTQTVITFVYLALIVVVFYFLFIRPQQKRAREQAALMESLKSGDRVITAGGLYGTIERVEDDIMELRIADSVIVDVAVSAVVRKVDAAGTPVDVDEEPPELRDKPKSGEVEEPEVRVDIDEHPGKDLDPGEDK